MFQRVYNLFTKQSEQPSQIPFLNGLQCLEFNEHSKVIFDNTQKEKYDEISLKYLEFGDHIDLSHLKNEALVFHVEGCADIVYPFDLLTKLNVVKKVNGRQFIKIPSDFTIPDIMLQKMKSSLEIHFNKLKFMSRVCLYFSSKKYIIQQDSEHRHPVQIFGKLGSFKANCDKKSFKIFNRYLIKGFFITGNVDNISSAIVNYFMKNPTSGSEIEVSIELVQHKLSENLIYCSFQSHCDYNSLSYDPDAVLDTRDTHTYRRSLNIRINDNDNGQFMVYTLGSNTISYSNGIFNLYANIHYKSSALFDSITAKYVHIFDDDQEYENYTPYGNKLLTEISQTFKSLCNKVKLYNNHIASRDVDLSDILIVDELINTFSKKI
jgi:hypothetical protein